MRLLAKAVRSLIRTINRELNQWNYNRQSLASPGVPEVFQIELTNHCPMTCVMCPRTASMTRPTGHMDMALFQRIIQETSTFSSDIFLHHFGDSLTHPHLAEFIHYATDHGVRTYLSTNPILLTSKHIRELVNSGLHEIVLSLDGVHSETSEAIRGKAARDVAEAERRLLELLEYRRQCGSKIPTVILQFVRQQLNAHETEAWLAKWRTVPGIDAVKIKSFVAWDGHDDRINVLRVNPAPDSHGLVCDKPWTSVTVLWDGRVVPCCFDYDGLYVLGNLREQTLKQIFQGEPMRNLRKVHRDAALADVRLCARCMDKEGYAVRKWYYPFNRWLLRRMPLGDEDAIQFAKARPTDSVRQEE